MPCTPTCAGGTINDVDAAALILPMAESDVTAAASDTLPGVVSPYGTDGDCSTAQSLPTGHRQLGFANWVRM